MASVVRDAMASCSATHPVLGSIRQLPCVWSSVWTPRWSYHEDVFWRFVESFSFGILSSHSSEVSDAGTYALVGAAAMIGERERHELID
jgi:hypothetical protein